MRQPYVVAAGDQRVRVITRADTDQVVLQLAGKIVEVLSPFEVGERLVAQKQPCLAAWYRAAKSGQMVHLAEGAGEGGLAALTQTASLAHE